jgi:tetratricopeptide (TPR) repeat protein
MNAVPAAAARSTSNVASPRTNWRHLRRGRTAAGAQAADHLPYHHPRFCADCNAEIDAAANAVIAFIEAGKLDDAERAARALVERWPDIYDGYDFLGMVHQARGDKHLAAEYYRKVIALVGEDPSLYDPQFKKHYEKRIARLNSA